MEGEEEIRVNQMSMEELSKEAAELKEKLENFQYESNEGQAIFKRLRVNYGEIDDHLRYLSKELSIKVLMDQEHKTLQSEAIALLIRNFRHHNSDLVAQL